MIGQTLSHFRIVAKLGEGGMGEVYRAEDTKLGREVAIKVLPAAVAGDEERLARFEREARVLASLNHPGIASIHQVEEDARVHFLVMELAEGEDLAARLGRGPLTVDEAMALGLQVAEALEEAHESGVVHRDLKPANVVLGADGRTKVLDFGLAKALEGDRGGDRSLTQSPTITAGMTQAGVILGTAAYMSPEQAVGNAVDKRTDIWAFGCLIYEMLTGHKAYDGDSVTETLSAVMRDEPDWAELPVSVPAAVRRLVERCLVKDPKERLRDIGEARIVLAQPYFEPEEESDGEASGARAAALGRASRNWPGLLAAALGVVAAALAGGWWATRSEPAATSLAPDLVRVTSDPGVAITPAAAPAGNLIAYASDRGDDGDLDIWVQPLPSGQPLQVTRSDADDLAPHFSPDGSRIVFRSERDGGGIYVVPALGGTERLVAAKGRQPRFSPDGRWISYSMGGRGSATQLYLVESTGSGPRRLVEDFPWASSPVWSPDSRHLLFEGQGPATDDGESPPDWWILSVESGDVRPSGARQALGSQYWRSTAERWLADPERLIVSQAAGDSSSLWELPISAWRQRVRGPLHRLTAGTRIDSAPSVVSGPDGKRIFFSSSSNRANLWRLPIEADSLAPSGPPERITDSVARDLWPSVSADGAKLAYLSYRLGGSDVWVKDLESGVETPLTMTPELEFFPRISPDGAHVSFISSGELFTVGTDGGVPVLLTEGVRWVTDWPADGLILALRDGGIVRIDVGTGETTQLIQEEGRNFYFAVASPDLQWFSFMEWSLADRTRRYVARLGESLIPESEWIPVTDGETVDEEAAWSPSGTVDYYVSERDGSRCLWAQRLDPGTKRPLGEPVAVLHTHEMRHAIADTRRNPQNIAVTRDAIYFSMRELASNIWMGTIEGR